MTSPGWKPLLFGDEAARARRIAIDIADEVDTYKSDAGRRDVFGALLDAYLARALDSDRHADRSLTAVANAFEQAAQLRSPALYGGLAGLGWTTAHVTDLCKDWIEPDETDPLDAIDSVLNEIAAHPRDGYDLISGIAGVAVYAFERMPRDEPRVILERIIDRLAADAEMTAVGVTWHTPAIQLPEYQRKETPYGFYNLGVAHGTPALAVTLARAARLGIRTEAARRLLDGLMLWVFDQQSPTGPGGRFVAWIPKGQPPLPTNSRESWCYGGLGLSVALLHAARLVGDAPREEARALDVARLEARRPIEQAGIKDMCLCHGGAGNGHLYNRLYQATGEEVFLEAAIKWLHIAMDARRPDAGGIGGYLFYCPKDRRDPSSGNALLPEPSFLSGSVGVGLALLAASSSQEPLWDRLLLADLPPARTIV